MHGHPGGFLKRPGFIPSVLLLAVALARIPSAYAGWYTNCPSCVQHLGGSGVAGPYGSQAECERERATSSFPWQACYSSGGDGGSADTSAQDAINAAKWEAYYRAKEEERLQKAAELQVKAQGARQSAVSSSQSLEYLYQQAAASGGVDFDGRGVKSSQLRYNKTTGRHDMSDVSAEHTIKDSDAILEDDPFTVCMRALPDDPTYAVDLAAVKTCGNTPFFSLSAFTARFDPKTLELFMDGMKKIPGMDHAFEAGKIWGFAAKLAGLWELAWIAKINEEMMPIGGAPTKRDVQLEFEKLIKEQGADALTGLLTDQAADKAKEFLDPQVLLKAGVLVEPLVKLEMSPLNKKITQWMTSDSESRTELADEPGQLASSFFKGLQK